MTSVTKRWAFGLILLTTLMTTLAQFFLKTGVHDAILPVPLAIGIALYALGSVLMIVSFKGGQVSLLYPITATSYVWVALISQFWFGEDVHLVRWIGIAVIITGILLIGLANKQHEGVEHAPVQ